MSNGTDITTIPLTPSAKRMLDRDHRGKGGFQSLLRRLRKQIVNDGAAVQMSSTDLEQWVRYSTKYGEGGFETRLRSVKAGKKR